MSAFRNRKKIKKATKKAQKIVQRSANHPNSIIAKIQEKRGTTAAATKFLSQNVSASANDKKAKSTRLSGALGTPQTASAYSAASRLISKKDARQEAKGRKKGLITDTGIVTQKGEQKIDKLNSKNRGSKRADKLGLDTALTVQQNELIKSRPGYDETQQLIAMNRAGLFPSASQYDKPIGPVQASGDFQGGTVGSGYQRGASIPGATITGDGSYSVPLGGKPTTTPGGTPLPGSDFYADSARNSFAQSTLGQEAGAGLDNNYLPYTPPGAPGESEAEKFLKNQYEAQAAIDADPKALQREFERMANSEVRALNATRASLLAAQNRENQNRVGTARAQAARGGLLGSDFGTQQMEATLGYNRALNQEINSQYDQAITSVLSNAREQAFKELQNIRALKQQGGEGYLQALELEQTRMDDGLTNVAADMYAKGIDPTQVDPATLSEIASNFNSTPQALMSKYLAVKDAYAQSDKGFSLGQGYAQYDADGNLIAYNPKVESATDGLSSVEANLLNAVINKYSADEIVSQAQQVPMIKNIIETVRQNPDSASNQLITLYTLVKNLDPNSAVREGELDLATKTNSFFGQFGDTLARVLKGRVLNPNATLELINGVETLANEWEKRGVEKIQQYKSQANAVGLGPNFDEFLAGMGGGESAQQQGYTPAFTNDAGETLYQGPDGLLYTESEIQSFNSASQGLSLEEAKRKIGSIESGGDYLALGPVVSSGPYRGQRAVGKYQVMEGNIPAWTKEAFGVAYSPNDFYNSPQMQEELVDYKFQQLYKEHGNWDDVASVWFTGQPASQGANRRDDLGTSGRQYVRNFNLA